jgi:homoserine kinase
MARPAFRAAPLRVRVPATSANLGPGFDALGLALGLYDEVMAQVTDDGELVVDVAGMGAASVPRNGRHLVVRSMRAAFKELGGQPRGLHLVCANHIPHGRGLGSSAAAIVAGIIAARALVVGGSERMDDDRVLALATGLEGHPDNVAACLRGGLTIAWTEAGDSGSAAGPSTASEVVGAVGVPVSPLLAPVAFVPGTSSSTHTARKLLPLSVPHPDAARNAGRAALLVTAVRERPDLLMIATEDWLHQSYRAPAMPRSAALVEELRAAGVPAVISGAGSTVLALTTVDTRPAALERSRRGWNAMPLDVDTGGATLIPV